MILTMVRQFEREMSAEMQAYQQELKADYQRTGYALEDILRYHRPGAAKTESMMRGELRELAKDARRVNAKHAPNFQRLAENYAAEQLVLAHQVDANVETAEEVRTGVQKKIEQIVRQHFLVDPVWIQTGMLTIIAELARMSSGGETPQAIAARLLSYEMLDGRSSVWRSTGNSLMLESDRAAWDAAMAIVQTYLVGAQELHPTRQTWQKQAIAAIDERTTDCCLQVHGQIRGLTEPFTLTGTPRYADQQQHSPFHWYCRTSEVLYLAEFEEIGISTQEMRDAARAEIEARESSGERVVINPADAVSRRN